MVAATTFTAITVAQMPLQAGILSTVKCTKAGRNPFPSITQNHFVCRAFCQNEYQNIHNSYALLLQIIFTTTGETYIFSNNCVSIISQPFCSVNTFSYHFFVMPKVICGICR